MRRSFPFRRSLPLRRALPLPEAAAITVLLFATIAVLFQAVPAAAQSGRGAYAGISAGHHRVDADHVDDGRPAVGVVGGWPVRPWIDLEGELQVARGVFRREYTGASLSFAPPGAPAAEHERLSVVTRYVRERRPQVLFSVGVAFHPRVAAGRVMPRLFVGLTGHRVEDSTTLEHLSLPPGVTREQVERILPPDRPASRDVGGLTVGAGLRIAVIGRLSLAPDLRYDYGSFGDEINNALRSSIRVVWRF